MSELVAVERSDRPATRVSLRLDLERLGLRHGMIVMVHTSLSRLGYVVGGEETVVDALLDAVGPSGTIMMPTHSAQLTDPAEWRNPPVPESWWQPIRDAMPPYDPRLTPTRSMGAAAEHFRHRPGVRRSGHPTVSAAAIGPAASRLLDDHRLDRGLGEGSPQARLYDLDGHVLLLGVGHANNTSLHLAEFRAMPDGCGLVSQRSPMLVDGRRVWVDHDEIDEDNDFDLLGAEFAATGRQRTGPVGAGTGHLMRARDVVDVATDWLRRNVYDVGG